ncbi:hypothetical protein BEWA_010670 [Theileria equi strain WA]|uniref:[histone H3]-lysine(4) N-trimethyltransferase n=1 Tax=Theileria equi strain WA TaxID=1537102 RepID=L0B1E3_THEEQ|nr:hypothetical protein BEWA_010670 [Theileria equi strain WA]AFZ81650.1 hypothetical protein BEWA_010670 [Theileria equi strain WA]|eukprot:XP_004831316.1 hypothetical protein BEWA_010670 [Theileria equi strain WA]
MSSFNSWNYNADNSKIDPNVRYLSNLESKIINEHNVRSAHVIKKDESDGILNNPEMFEHDSPKKRSRVKNDIPRELMGLCIDMDWCKDISRTDRRNFAKTLPPTHKKGSDYYFQQSSIEDNKSSTKKRTVVRKTESINQAEIKGHSKNTQNSSFIKDEKSYKKRESAHDRSNVSLRNSSESENMLSNLEFDMDMVLKPKSHFILYRLVNCEYKAKNTKVLVKTKQTHIEVYPGVYLVKGITDYGLVSFSRIRNLLPKLNSKFANSITVTNDFLHDFKHNTATYKNGLDYGPLSCFIFEDIALFEEGSKVDLCVVLKSINVENYLFDIKRSRNLPQTQNSPKDVASLSCLSPLGLSSDFYSDNHWCIVFSRIDGKIKPNIRKINNNSNIKTYDETCVIEDKELSALKQIILRNLFFQKYKDIPKNFEYDEGIFLELCSYKKCSMLDASNSEISCLSCFIAIQIFTADGYYKLTSLSSNKMGGCETSEVIIFNVADPFTVSKHPNKTNTPNRRVNENDLSDINGKYSYDGITDLQEKSQITEDDLTLDSIHRITRRMVKELQSTDSENKILKDVKNDQKNELTPPKRSAPYKQTEDEKTIKMQSKTDENTTLSDNRNKRIKNTNETTIKPNNVTLKPFVLDVNDSNSGFTFVGYLIKFTQVDKNQIPNHDSYWNYAVIKYWDPKCRAFFVHLIKEEFCTSDESLLTNFLRDNSDDYFSDSVCWITSQSKYVLILSSDVVFDRSFALRHSKSTYNTSSKLLDEEPICKVCNKRIIYVRENFNAFPSRFSSREFDVTMTIMEFIKICKLKFDKPNYFFHNPLHSTIASLRELEKYNKKTIKTLLENNLDITSLILGSFERDLINIYGRSLLYFCVKIIFWIRKICGIKKSVQPDTMIKVVHWGLKCSTCKGFYHAKCLQYQHLRKPSPIMTNNNIIKRLSHHKLMCKIFRNQSSSGTYNTNITSLPDLVGNYNDYDIIYHNDGGSNTKTSGKSAKSSEKELKHLFSGPLPTNPSGKEDHMLLFPIFERSSESDSWVCHDCSICTYCCMPINDKSAKQRFCQVDNIYDPSSKSSRQYPQSFEEKLDSLQRNSQEVKVKDVKCVSCNLSAHRNCCNPPVPNLLFIESWKCDWCSQCISCGYRDTNGTEYLHWGLFFLLCLKCWESLEKNNFCGVCYKVWTNYDSVTQKWVQCEGCKLWIHVECDDLAQIITDCPSSRSQNYRCKVCRSSNKIYRCMKLLEQVFLVDKLNQFRYPVSPGCVVYWRLVTRPMNLITLLSKLENGEYKNINDFIFDIFLIPYNAKMVNMPNTKIYKFANIFERKCKQIVSSIMQLSLTEIDSIFESEIRKGDNILPIEPYISDISYADSNNDNGNNCIIASDGNEGVMNLFSDESALKNKERNDTNHDFVTSSKTDEFSGSFPNLHNNHVYKRKYDDFFQSGFDTLLYKIFGISSYQKTLILSQNFLPKSFVPCGLNYVISSVLSLMGKITFKGVCNIHETYDDLIKNKKFILLQSIDDDNPKELYLDDESFLDEISNYFNGTKDLGILWKDFCIVCGSYSQQHYLIFCVICGEAMHYYCAGLLYPPVVVKYDKFRCSSCSKCDYCDVKFPSNHSYDIGNINNLEFASVLGWIPRSISCALYYTPPVPDDTEEKINDFTKLLLPRNTFSPQINTPSFVPRNFDKTISTPAISSFQNYINMNEDLISKITTPFPKPYLIPPKNNIAPGRLISMEQNFPIHSVKCAICGLSTHLSCLRKLVPFRDIKEQNLSDNLTQINDKSQTLLLHENFIATVSNKHKITPFINYKSRSVFKNKSAYEFGRSKLQIGTNDSIMQTNPNVQFNLANNFSNTLKANLNMNDSQKVDDSNVTSYGKIMNKVVIDKSNTSNIPGRDTYSVVLHSGSSQDSPPKHINEDVNDTILSTETSESNSIGINDSKSIEEPPYTNTNKPLPPRILNVAKKLAKCDELLKRIESEVSKNRVYYPNESKNNFYSNILKMGNSESHRQFGKVRGFDISKLTKGKGDNILNAHDDSEYLFTKSFHLNRLKGMPTDSMNPLQIQSNANIDNGINNGWKYDGSGIFTCGKICGDVLCDLKSRFFNSNQIFLALSLLEQFDIIQQIYNMDNLSENTTNTHSMKIRMKCNEGNDGENTNMNNENNNFIIGNCLLCGTLIQKGGILFNKHDRPDGEQTITEHIIPPLFVTNFILCKLCKSWRRYLRNMIHKIKGTNLHIYNRNRDIIPDDKSINLSKINIKESQTLIAQKRFLVDDDFISSHSNIFDLQLAFAQMDQMSSNTMVKTISLIRHLILTSENIMRYIFSISSSILPKNAVETSVKRLLKNFIHSKAFFPGGIQSSIYLSMANSPLSPVIYTFWIHSLLNIHNERKMLKIFNQVNENYFDTRLKSFYNTLFDINWVVNNCSKLGHPTNTQLKTFKHRETENNSNLDGKYTSEVYSPLKYASQTSNFKHTDFNRNMTEMNSSVKNNRASLKQRRIKASYHIMIKRFTNLIASSIRFYWTYRELLSYKIFFKQLDFHTNFHKALSDANLNQNSIKLLSKRMQQVLYYIINGDNDEMYQNKNSIKYPYFRRHLAHLILNGELNFYKDIQQRFDLCCLTPHARIGKGTASPSFVLGKIAYEAETILYFLSQFSKFCRNIQEISYKKLYSQEKYNPSLNMSNPKDLSIQVETTLTDQENGHKIFENSDSYTDSNIENSKNCAYFNLDDFNSFMKLTYKKMVKRFNRSTIRKSNHIESLIYKRVGASLIVETVSARAVTGDVALCDETIENFGCICSVKNLSENEYEQNPMLKEYFRQQSDILGHDTCDRLKFLQTLLPTRIIYCNADASMEKKVSEDIITPHMDNSCCLCSISESTLLRGSLIPWRNGYIHSECLLWSVDNIYLPRTFNVVFDDILFGYEDKLNVEVDNLERYATLLQNDDQEKGESEEIHHRERVYNLNLLSLPIMPPVQIPDFVVESCLTKASVTRCHWCKNNGASVICSGKSCNVSFHLSCTFIASNRLICAIARKENLFKIDYSSFDLLFPAKIYFTKRKIWCTSCFRKDIISGLRGNRVKDLICLNQNNLKAFFSLEGMSPNSTFVILKQILQSVRIIPKMVSYKNLDFFMVSRSQLYNHAKSSYMHSMYGHPLEIKGSGFIESIIKPREKLEVERYSGKHSLDINHILGTQNSVPSQYNFDSKYFLYGKVDLFNSPFSSETIPREKSIRPNAENASDNQLQSEVIRIGSLTILNIGDALLFGDNGRVYPIGFTSVRIFWNKKYYSNSRSSEESQNSTNSNPYRNSYICTIRARNGVPYFSIDLIFPPNSNIKSRRLSHGTNINAVYETFVRFIGSTNVKPMEPETFFGTNLHIVLQKLRFDLSMAFMHRASKFSKIASFEKSVLGNGNASITKGNICLGEHYTNFPFKIRRKNMNELISTTLDFKDSEPCEVDCDSRTNRTRSRKQYDMSNNAMQYRYLISLPPEKRLDVKPSAIHGLGLFTTEDITAGEPVVEYVGELIRDIISDKREEIYSESQGGDGSCYMFRLDDELIVDATRKGNMSRFINHSCDPNCLCRIITCEYGLKHIVVFAKSDLKAGDEVTYDYQFGVESETRKLQCLCGAPNCLGRMN